MSISPPQDAPLRYADYSRVSSQIQADRELSIPAQQREIKDYAKAEGRQWLHACAFQDAGISGTTTERPGLQAMLDAARRREFDVLVIHKMDRLSREELDFLVIKAELKKFGIVIASVTEPFAGGTHPMDEMMETMSRGFAKLYISNLRREIKKGLRQAAEQGRQNGLPPYGYRHKDTAKRGNGWQVDPDHGPWVPRLFARFAEGDLTLAGFARWVNEQAAPLPHTRNGRHRTLGWNPRTLGCILGNRAYLGEISYDDHIRPGAHPPLVAPGVFAQVEAIMSVRGRQNGQQSRRDNAPDTSSEGSPALLNGGLMRCPLCEEAGSASALVLVSWRTVTRRDGTRARYCYYACGCHERMMSMKRLGGAWGGRPCPGYSISEKCVMQMLCAILRDVASPETTRVTSPRKPHLHQNHLHQNHLRLTTVPLPPAPLTDTPEAISREIAQAASLRARYQEMAAKGLMTDDELGEQLAGLARRSAALEARRTAAEAPEPHLSPSAATDLLHILEDKGLPAVMRRDKIRLLVQQITPWADKAGLTIVARTIPNLPAK